MPCTNLNSFYNNQCQLLADAPKEFLAVLVLNMSIVIVSLIFLHFYWIKPLGIEFPKFNEHEEETYETVFTLREALLYNAKYLWEFNPNYWIKVCGYYQTMKQVNSVEGFQFLYVQRQFFVLMLIFLFISFVSLFTIPNVSILSLFVMDQTFTYGYQCMMTTIYTIVLLWFLNNMMHAVTSINDDLKTRWLLQHTLHLKGVPPEFSEDQIHDLIQQYLTSPHPTGKVLSITKLPDYTSLLELEISKNEWKAYEEYLFYEKPPLLMRVLPKKYQTADFYSQKSKDLEEEQRKIIQDSNFGSGHVFVVVDSDEAVSHLIDKYTSTHAQMRCCREIAKTFNETFCHNVEEHTEDDEQLNQRTFRRIQNRNDVHTLMVARSKTWVSPGSPMENLSIDMTSPRNQFKIEDRPVYDIQVSLSRMGEDQDKPLLIIVKDAPPPDDILFINFTQSMKTDLCRNATFNIGVFLLLFFCTSPASIFQYIGLQKTVGSISHNVFLQYGIVLMIDGINSIILLIIEYSVQFQKPSGRWVYQKSVYNRCVFYLTMNMLFIPAVSFVAITNIYQLLFHEIGNLLVIIQSIYFLVNGKFFANLILASASSAFFNYLLRLSDLFFAWGNVKFATYQRKKMQDKSHHHFQRPGTEFRYGYFYGLQIAVLYIVMTFCTNVPIIQLCGAIYYSLRLYQDSFILHWYFREDMNSQSQLAQKVILSAGISVIPLQLVDLSIFLVAQQSLYLFITIILISITILMNIHMSHSKDNMQKAKKDTINQSWGQPSVFDLQKWIEQYKHPIKINYNEEAD